MNITYNEYVCREYMGGLQEPGPPVVLPYT